MATTTALAATGVEQLGVERLQSKQAAVKELGQDEFFKLMITQLKNQDPMKPMENGEFLAQIAQFSTVNGITSLQQSFATLASSLQSGQALQASTMVGRSVLLASDRVQLGSDAAASGAVELDREATEVTVTISDATGQVVKRLNLGAHAAGSVPFTWAGVDEFGASVPQGDYRVSAQASYGVGAPQALTTLARVKVESVTIPGAGQTPILNLAGQQQVPLSDVRQVM
ncbi:MAG: flagellar hook assembly protein FlgD [Gammaproteobacteria bacterium]|nr:flagellar hook assembly protein FlgD [Gammaproteobacteria bacterium]